MKKLNDKNIKKQLTGVVFYVIIYNVADRGIAQPVEQRSPKPRVPSSILGAPARIY